MSSPHRHRALDRFPVRLSGPLARLAPRRPADPAEALFHGIRWRLTATYAAVLAGILLLSGLLLYATMNEVLLGPVNDTLRTSANQISTLWQTTPQLDPRYVCPVPSSAIQNVPYVECFAEGKVGVLQIPPPDAFTDPSLIQAALHSRTSDATDTVNAGSGLGAIRRYALAVHYPNGDGDVLGVVQVGMPIQGQLTALRVLAILLLLLGVLTLAGAMLGGILLSWRALAPARLAFERQQAFIGDAAHELRTPLTLLRANAEVLLRGRERLDPEDALLLEDIVAEAGHMSRLATSMLELARLDASARPLERDVHDLAELGRAVSGRAQSLAKEAGLTLAVEAPMPVLVLGERVQLEELVLILLDNAIKYNVPGGSVTLSVTRDGPLARLAVRDTGPGIAAEHLARLGERFYRVDKARSRELGGAGLGLAIARRIAAAHGGMLVFESAPSRGTTVTLTLPAAG